MSTPASDRGRGEMPDALQLGARDIASHATVVIVDDNPANVELLRRLVTTAGVHRVETFTDPRAAIAHCGVSLPDLILLDLHMPGLDGFEVMEQLALVVGADQFVPILVVTADATTEIKQRALAAGAKDFLTKPFDRTEVLLRVANLLETSALYGRLEQHVSALRADLDARTLAEREAADEREQQQRRIDHALTPGVLTMVFQPIADLVTGDVVGAEALARFATEPYRPPNEWFAAAADVGRGVELELAAVTAALEVLDQFPADAFLAVNASPATVIRSELASLLARYPGERLVVELTEHTRVDDYNTLLDALDRLREGGVRIAVDDTGAGYAGFQHLLRLRPDIIKLDTTLTRGIDADPVRRSLAAALATFAAEIQATIIAEGIEISGELTTLQRIGIPWGQGYHLARPGRLPFPAQRLAALT
jgi:EAL domain-containing protein (putative c-di-GMP-specific phosphodiesterase class I)/DNA-binding response OmpR family regulator